MTVTLYHGPPDSKVEPPPHHGTIWAEGEILYLQFPAIEEITCEGKPLLRIAGHVLRFPANSEGLRSAQMVLHIRRDMLKKENEGLLLVFAQVGDDLRAILDIYKKILP
ncbi:hypothetical protein [Bradyrhizobium mercantei]|uniref:hypothetical protein n=1 Tax=Bradyrhizobium mercantei TaxID=1904807 RepID=UPI000975F574|nr:hypothetical protein [Bradyrhizobium mercantei]